MELRNKLLDLLIYALCIILAVLALKYVLPLIAPVLLAFCIAGIVEPTVSKHSSIKLSRTAAAGIMTVSIIIAALGMLSLILGRGVSFLAGFIGAPPKELFDGFPPELLDMLSSATGKLLGMLTNLAGKAPSVLLFAFTTGICVFSISSHFPYLMGLIKKVLPETVYKKLSPVWHDISFAGGSWVKAQFILALVCFGVTLIFLTFLRIPQAIFISALTAIADLLPVIGAGIILLPRAIIAFHGGEINLAIGLLGCFAAVTLVKNLLTPKLLGDVLGLHPAIMLSSIYAGYKAFGTMGMIFLPFGAALFGKILTRSNK